LFLKSLIQYYVESITFIVIIIGLTACLGFWRFLNVPSRKERKVVYHCVACCLLGTLSEVELTNILTWLELLSRFRSQKGSLLNIPVIPAVNGWVFQKHNCWVQLEVWFSEQTFWKKKGLFTIVVNIVYNF
jgi:hypothetical protein